MQLEVKAESEVKKVEAVRLRYIATVLDHVRDLMGSHVVAVAETVDPEFKNREPVRGK